MFLNYIVKNIHRIKIYELKAVAAKLKNETTVQQNNISFLELFLVAITQI